MHKPAPTTEKQTWKKTRVRVPREYAGAGPTPPSVGVTPKVSLQKTTKIPAPTDTSRDKTMSNMVSCRKYVPMQPNPGYQKRTAKDSFLVAESSLLYVNQLKHHGRSTDVRSLYKREGMEADAAGPSDSGQSRGGVNCGEEPTGSDPGSEKSGSAMRGVPDTVPDNAIPEVQTPATDQDQHADYHSELQGNGEMEGKSKSVRKFFCW